uniref:Nose resistant-to-fluoxetine protein N-terminal domain-containing protein n=2 Tax=Timema TaxID=61471 RepID=A0A7R9E5M8_9NEOP|nr:unnamed protein product [Timema monikensis]
MRPPKLLRMGKSNLESLSSELRRVFLNGFPLSLHANVGSLHLYSTFPIPNPLAQLILETGSKTRGYVFKYHRLKTSPLDHSTAERPHALSVTLVLDNIAGDRDIRIQITAHVPSYAGANNKTLWGEPINCVSYTDRVAAAVTNDNTNLCGYMVSCCQHDDPSSRESQFSKPELQGLYPMIQCGVIASDNDNSSGTEKFTRSRKNVVLGSIPYDGVWDSGGYSEEGGSVLGLPSFLEQVLSDIENVKCRNDTFLFLQELQNLSTWAVQMLDATSKLPSGLLFGNIKDLGNYDECLAVRASSEEENRENFRGQYCLVKLEGLAYFPSFAKFEWSVCLPSTCSADDLQWTLNNVLRNVDHLLGLHVSAKANSNHCYVASPLRLQTRDFAIGAVAILFFLFLGLASAYELFSKWKQKNEMFTKEGSYSKILIAFSIPNNVKKLLSLEAPPGTITCIDGIRFLTILWVIFTHKIFCLTLEPWSNKIFLMDAPCSPTPSSLWKCFMPIILFPVGRAPQVGNHCSIATGLTPAYAAMIAVFATVYVYLGSGPGWHNGVEHQSEICRENWLWNILYVNNYVDSNRKCMLQTWYLSADMHLFLFAPLLVYPLWKWPKLGKVVMVAAISVSVTIPLATIYIYNYPGVHYSSLHDDLLSDYAQYIYYPTHQRMSPYFAGLALGYILHGYRNTKKCTIPKWVSIFFWGLSLTTLAAVIFGPYEMIQFDHQYDVIESSIYGGVHRFAWAIAVGWIVLACSSGHGGLINKGLSARLFRPLSRLSYCIFLTHLGVLHYGVSRIKSARYMDDYNIVHDFAGDVTVTVVLSVILYVTFESPFLAVTKILTDKINKIRRQENNNMIKPVV